MYPQPQIESASMLTKLQSALYCGDLQRKVMVIKIYLTLFCLQTMYLFNPPIGSEDRGQKRLIFTDIKRMVTLKMS